MAESDRLARRSRATAPAPSPSHRPVIYVMTPRHARRFVESLGAARALSERELAALDAFAAEKRRRDWLAGRLAAKMLVARTLVRNHGGAAPPLRDIEIGYDAAGAPCFTVVGRPGLERGWSIAISHTGGYGACAVGRTATVGRVGVDLERDQVLRPELLRYFLSEDERRRLRETTAGQAVTPVALWAIKEAVIKAAPRRTGRSMWNVDLTWDEAGRVSATIPGSAGRDARVAAGCERRGGLLLAYATCREAGED